MILLLIDQLVKGFQIDNFRHKLLIRQPLADIHPLLEYRNGGVELGNRCRDGGAFGLLLRALAVQRRELGRKFRRLTHQELALHRH
jgi:hypothetical protein